MISLVELAKEFAENAKINSEMSARAVSRRLKFLFTVVCSFLIIRFVKPNITYSEDNVKIVFRKSFGIIKIHIK